MNKKNLINIILIVIIFVAIGAMGYFIFIKKSETIPEESTKRYTNSLLGIEFSYPRNFIPYLRDNEYLGDQPSRFVSGKDSYAPLDENSYFVITLNGVKGYYDCPSLENSEMSYSGSYEDIQQFIQEGKPIKFENCKEIIQTIDQAAQNSAYHKLKPFGENPIIKTLQIEGQEARLIIPSENSINERELIVELKKSVFLLDKYWTFLVIHTSQDPDGKTMKTILESLTFR